MKEIAELNFPEDVRYSQSHEWVKADGDTARIGITDYAQDQLGDIVFVELPDVGESFEKGAEFGVAGAVHQHPDERGRGRGCCCGRGRGVPRIPARMPRAGPCIPAAVGDAPG